MKAIFYVLPFVLGLSACGSDASSSDGSSDQGKKLVDLTDAEREQFCTTNRDSFLALLAGGCTLSGLDAPTPAQCTMARDQCAADVSPDTTVCGSEGAPPPDFSDCGTLRVAQVEGCLAESKSFFAGLSCDSAGQEPTAPSCLQAIETSCPVLLGGGF